MTILAGGVTGGRGTQKGPFGKEFVLFVVVVVVVVVDLYALTRSPLLSAGVGGYIYIYI